MKRPIYPSTPVLFLALPILVLLGWLVQGDDQLDAEDSAPSNQSLPVAMADQPRSPRLNVPDGFHVSLFADDRLAHNAYSLAPASSGLIAVSGPGYIRLLADHDQDGRAELVSTFADGPQSGAQGLFFDGSDLLAVGDGGLLRYRDADGDFRADGPPVKLLSLKTGGEHFAHAVRRGPDGRWYLICGNMTFDDPPPITDPHSPIANPRAGVLLRFDYSAKDDTVRNLAVVADGMRNAYDFDFLRSGDIVTYDSDGEREVSLPWYRPTRVFRLLPGSDAGWFSRSWKFPSGFLEMPETIADLGRGSPTGVLVLRDARWPEPFDNAILVCDWTFGRVVAIPLDDRDRPGEPLEFITASGVTGFAPTDIVQAADGSLIVSSGGRGTTGRLFRITPETFIKGAPTKSTVANQAGVLRKGLRANPAPARIADALCRDEPLLRRVGLEALAASLAGESLGEEAFEMLSAPLLASLADAEPNLRKLAMHVVAKFSQEDQQRLSRLIANDDEATQIRFEIGRHRGNRELKLELLEIAFDAIESPDLEIRTRFDAVRLAQIALGGVGEPGHLRETFAGYTAGADLSHHEEVLEHYATRWAALFPTGRPDVDRELVRLIAMLAPKSPAALDKLLAHITPESHPTRDLHHLFAIARLRTDRTEKQGEVIAAALLSLDKKLASHDLFRDSYWNVRLRDLVSALSEADPRLWERMIESPDFRRPRQVSLLAAAPRAIRLRAAEVFLKRTQSGPEAWTPAVISLIAELSTDATLHALREAHEQPHLRNSALQGLARHPKGADYAKFVAGLEIRDLETISSCLDALNSLDLDAETAEIAALARAVGRLDRNRKAYALRDRVVERLRRFTGETFGFEFGEAGYRPQGDPVARWMNYARDIDPGEFTAGEGWESLLPRLQAAAELTGDAWRGAALFRDLACDRCHAGGVVGPDLAGVSGRFSRTDLFRAIAQPDRDISARYRGILVQTRAGKIYTGLIAYESADGITLKDGQETWRIAADQIELRQPLKTSLMPRGLLREAGPQDLADLEAYLESL